MQQKWWKLDIYFFRQFTMEIDFNGHEGREENIDYLEGLQITVQEVKEIMEDLDVRKALEPDGLSSWVLRECSKQLADENQSIIVSSLTEGKVTADWKRADIIPIYKGGCQEDPWNYRSVSLTSVIKKITLRELRERTRVSKKAL